MKSSRENDKPKPSKKLRQSTLFENFSFERKNRPSSKGEVEMNPIQNISLDIGDNKDLTSSNRNRDNIGNVAGSSSETQYTDSVETVGCGENNESQSNVSVDLFPDLDSDSNTMTFNDENYMSQKEISYIENLSLNRAPTCLKTLPPLWSDSTNVILVNCKIIPNRVPRPFPNVFRDAWDSEHVRLPCSPLNMYPTKNPVTKNDEIKSRWEIIQTSLLRPMASTLDLREAILMYNSQYESRWNFQELNRFFTDILEPDETVFFFSNLLPKIVALALQLPDCCTHPIPLLKRNKKVSVTLSQYQIGCLLANALLCTFPRRNSQSRDSEYATYPDINFNRLYSNAKKDIKMEKFKCIFNYFKRITTDSPSGLVTFERRSLDYFPLWSSSNKPLTKLYISAEGVIEKDGAGLLQVDFANKGVGGGVLGFGCVQEEIRFLICPELIISRLFTERLWDSEVLVITGCEQFNDHSGYADSFSWEGDYIDTTPRDSWQRRCTQIVAMDALSFGDRKTQFSPTCVGREINKAFCGFYEAGVAPENLTAVATGNWGCGVYRGDPRLKALIQLMAASQARRDLVYFTFGDEQLRDSVESLYQFLILNKVTVGVLWNIIKRFYTEVILINSEKNLYTFIFEELL